MAKRIMRIGALVLVGATALWLATFGSFKQEVRQSVTGGYPLPAFRLPVLDSALFSGDTTFVDSESLRGKVVLLTWWATWCGPCRAEQPSLLALQRDFASDGLVVLGVLHQDDPRRALEWLAEHDRKGLHTVVGSKAFARAYRVGGLPNTALVDRRGTITELFLGYWPERDAYLRKQVRRLVAAGATSS